MKELYSVIDKAGFGHIVDENNQYYEPTIKTIRKPFIHNETGVKIGEEVITTYKICTNDCISKAKLISFLEDKIKENLLNKEYTYSGNFWFYKGKEEAYEEVLDFANKGDKDDTKF